uniref:Uncharacterized protein n=1 Tax=Candidatus Kentrum sp. LFY TaxID=2126342 RepID=A0A450V6X4_9GAMM|nr:MAG: hypothetical protein BECKLFY1418A_GA0070994_11187 [Candidatus Kentron sp. LFY]
MDGAGDAPYRFGLCAGKQLYLAYTRWCRVNGVRFPRNSIQLLDRAGKMPGWFCGEEALIKLDCYVIFYPLALLYLQAQSTIL